MRIGFCFSLKYGVSPKGNDSSEVESRSHLIAEMVAGSCRLRRSFTSTRRVEHEIRARAQSFGVAGKENSADLEKGRRYSTDPACASPALRRWIENQIRGGIQPVGAG